MDIVGDYSHLLSYLLNTEYRWLIANDKNRAMDGMAYRDEYANGDAQTLAYLNDNLPNPCSVLEMLVALAVRCEFDIMHDPYEDADRSHFWFWTMIDNLGLSQFDDRHFNQDEASYILWNWLDHNFDPDGTGSPFPLQYPIEDSRGLEIWSQMNRWLDEHYEY